MSPLVSSDSSGAINVYCALSETLGIGHSIFTADTSITARATKKQEKGMPCVVGITQAHSEAWRGGGECRGATQYAGGLLDGQKDPSLSSSIYNKMWSFHCTTSRPHERICMSCTEISRLNVVSTDGRGNSICCNTRRTTDMFRNVPAIRWLGIHSQS